MKENSVKIYRICQHVVFSLFLIIFLYMLSGFYVEKKLDDVWQRLGLSPTDGVNNIKFSLKNGSLYYYGAKKAPSIPAGDRVSIIKELAAQARSYAKSDAFLKEYQKDRERKKPVPYIPPTETREEIIAREKLRIERNIKIMEENLNSENEKVRNGAKAGLPRAQKELTEINDPNNRVINQRLESSRRMVEQAKKLNEEKLLKWETENPEDPQWLVKKRLEEVLAITADVDYNAELTEKNGVKKFVDPAYEKRPKEWKLAFRAGKEATDAVRSIAQQWLKELK